jgi:hypothetical protein
MKSASRRMARTIRQTKSIASVGLSLAKTASSASKLAMSSGGVVGHRGPMMVAAMALPSLANAAEMQRMGSEKALAALSAGPSILSAFVAAQLAWTKFALTQASLGGMMFQGLLQSKATPLTAGRVLAAATERSWANSFDAAMSLSRTGQSMMQQAFRPFQKAVSANAERLARAA